MSAALSNPHDPSAPTGFEVLAGQRLMPSLRLALHYVLTVGAQRYPRLFLGPHAWREEAALTLAALLEAHTLASHNASFGEHFYNLRRVPATAAPERSDSRGRRLALLLLLLPYARIRLEELIDPPLEMDDDDPNSQAQTEPPSWRHRALRLLWRVCCAASDGACLVQLLSFLFGHSQFPSLQHRILGVMLQRAQPTQQLTAAASKPLAGAERVRAALELPLQHAQHLLLISVFGFRLLEHWHAPSHGAESRGSMVPPPPPLPPLPPGQSAWPPPSVCPTCRMVAQDPIASPSGFVFCEKCIYPAVARTGRCPVTDQPLRVPELRRLYETSRPATM
tara:strand:- start:51 stop:1058 length:1008 start_codon:yes stop_codon:yes gene_type:complete